MERYDLGDRLGGLRSSRERWALIGPPLPSSQGPWETRPSVVSASPIARVRAIIRSTSVIVVRGLMKHGRIAYLPATTVVDGTMPSIRILWAISAFRSSSAFL